MPKKLILCDCLGSQSIDADGVAQASGLACSRVYTSLCTAQIDAAAGAIEAGDAIIACQQERQRFEDLAFSLDAPSPGFVDLRDRAGWTRDTGSALPKMAALAAEAALSVPRGRSVDVISDGVCLVIGSGEVALSAARDLCDILSVTLLLTEADALSPDPRFDTVVGVLKRAEGALGGFDVRIDALQQVEPGGRGAPQLSSPKNGGVSRCDIILDLTGGTPLFSAPEKREGYLRAEPRNAPAVARVVLEASQLLGSFEKPLYVRLEPSLCAHSRAGQIACSNCLDICPTGAILPDGDHVVIDPMICAGCGSCAALCPSGAIAYDAPPVEVIFRRFETLTATYRKAGGAAPRLLVCDTEHGREMISLAARYGAGLPADVIPLDVAALAGFGHAEMLAALACGFSRIDILLSPSTERDALTRELALASAVAGEDKISLLDLTDPDALSETLFEARAQDRAPEVATDTILPLGTRRQVARLAARALRPGADSIALPDGAPYGAVVVDTDACTLCLSCASLCPSGALGDSPDMPQLRFQEDACIQCGLCAGVCPEQAISLVPQLDLTDAAFSQRVLNEEEPFACIECGTLFGVKSIVEKISAQLGGKHSMFGNPEAARMIQMCDDCRVNAQFHSGENPLGGKERPRVRTTDDYFSKRKDH